MTSWNKQQVMQMFNTYLQGRDCHGLDTTNRAFDLLDCWREAIDNLMTGPSPNRTKGCDLLWFWNTFGMCSVPGGLRDDLPHLVDAFRYLLPPYKGQGLTLYRGELESRHATGVHGISWTPVLEIAEMFADRRLLDEGRGVLLKIEATPNMIVVKVSDHLEQTMKLGENEYIVDPRLIRGTVSVVIARDSGHNS